MSISKNTRTSKCWSHIFLAYSDPVNIIMNKNVAIFISKYPQNIFEPTHSYDGNKYIYFKCNLFLTCEIDKRPLAHQGNFSTINTTILPSYDNIEYNIVVLENCRCFHVNLTVNELLFRRVVIYFSRSVLRSFIDETVLTKADVCK